jgi:CHAT domain-containing protein/tetratricopeptide (TPR) repeat protein
MFNQHASYVLRLAVGLLSLLAISPRAWGWPQANGAAPQSAPPARAGVPVQQQIPPAEVKARQELARAIQLARADGNDAAAISVAREALKAHIKPARGEPDDLTIQALSLIADLQRRSGELAAEVGTRRELLDALTASVVRDDWRVAEARNRLADVNDRLKFTPAQRNLSSAATECFNRAIALTNAGRLGEALPLAVEATGQYRELHGDDHRDVSGALMLRGIIHQARREYATAGSMLDQAIVMRRKILGENHPDTILVLTQIASLAEARGDIAHATRLFERAAELDQQNAAADVEAHARLLETIGRLHEVHGDHAGARPYLEHAAAILERVAFDAARRAGVSGRFGPLGGGIGGFGDPGMFGNGRGSRLGSQFSVIDGMFGLGRSPGGGLGGFTPGLTPRRQRATRDRPSRFGIPSSPFLDDILPRGPGNSDDLLAMVENPSHPWTLRLRAMRMYVEAASSAQAGPVATISSAFESEAIRGDAWIAYARNLGRLADVAEAQGEVERARLLRLRSVAVGLEATDPSEATRGAYAEFLDGFITLILEMDESGLGQDLASQSVVDRKLAWGNRHPAYAAGLDRLADVLSARGDSIQAMLLYEKAREVRRAALGDDHFELASSSYRLALLHQRTGDREEARRQAGESLAMSEKFVMTGLPFLPERQRLALLAQSTRALSLYLDVTADGVDNAIEVYRHLVAWKGVATEAVAAQRAAAATPELRVLFEELSRARDELNQLFYALVPEGQAAAHARRVRAHTKLRDELEARLAQAVRWQPEGPSPLEVAQAVPPGTVLIDFARYQHYVPADSPEGPPLKPSLSKTHFRLTPGTGPAMRFEARYAAFVVRPGDPRPLRVELGLAALIDEAVVTWLDRIENGGDMEGPAQQLARDLWSPLAPHVAGVRQVLVSPDGSLSFLPWAALPGKVAGTYLLADHAFGLVGAARVLARNRRPPDASQKRNLLVVGGVDYSSAESERPTGPKHTELAVRSAPVANRGLKLDDLPGTLVEANAIIKLFRDEDAGASDIMLLSGPQATKDRTRRSLAGKRFLHLATHGYFASPEFASALVPDETGRPMHSLEGMDRSEVRGLYPGLLSGMVFAGANRPPKDAITGLVDLGAAVMTAEEIAGLDLSACDLAVLSACDTGRGAVAGGEGVLGLQRAFHQAGARTVVASLWKVNDTATAALMALFYDRLWRQNTPPIEALRDAQLALYRHPELVGQLAKARGTPDFDKFVQRPELAFDAGRDQRPRSAAPLKQWAAFVVSGSGK